MPSRGWTEFDSRRALYLEITATGMPNDLLRRGVHALASSILAVSASTARPHDGPEHQDQHQHQLDEDSA